MKKLIQNPAVSDIDTGVAAAATVLVTLGGLISLSMFVALTSRLLL